MIRRWFLLHTANKEASTIALLIIFVLVTVLLILAIITMSELLDVIRTVKMEGRL